MCQIRVWALARKEAMSYDSSLFVFRVQWISTDGVGGIPGKNIYIVCMYVPV